MRSIKTYLEILRKKGLYVCLREAKKAVWPIWWTHSPAAISQIQAERASGYLWRKYGSLIIQPLEEPGKQSAPTRIIWMCWLQGLDNAPEIVQKCVASVKHHMPDYKVQILTSENIFDFVSLPEHIVRKYQKGTISFTHFSDILRTALLVQHGGIWLDATVLLTDELPTQMTETPLFLLQKSKLSQIPHMGSSWFIVANKGNVILKRVLELLYVYWEKENKLRDYYLFHLLFYLVLENNEEGKHARRTIPYVSNVDAHTLQFSLFDEYNEHIWQQIISRSPIHKLTWKFKDTSLLKKQGTYYNHILHLS